MCTPACRSLAIKCQHREVVTGAAPKPPLDPHLPQVNEFEEFSSLGQHMSLAGGLGRDWGIAV